MEKKGKKSRILKNATIHFAMKYPKVFGTEVTKVS